MLLSSWYQRSYFLCRGGSSALDIYRMPVLLQHFRGEYQALLLAFLCLAFTFWKTTLYMIQYTPLCKGSKLVNHLDWATYIFLFWGTNGWWIIVPFLSLISLWRILMSMVTYQHDLKQN